MDTEQTEQQQAPVEAPAPKPDDGIDELLSQFAAETKQPEPAAEPEGTVSNDELDKLLNSLGPDPRLSELEQQLGTANGELQALRQAEYDRQEEKAFDTFCAAIRDQVQADNLPERWIEDKCISLAVKDRAILDAWRYRNVDRNGADRALRQVEEAINFLQRNPAQADPQKLAALQERGHQLGLAYNARAILTRLERAVIKEAKAHKVYDAQVSEDRAAVAAAIRGANAPVPAEAPPNLGQMDTQQYRAYLKSLGITTGF
jgi:hypothetical protein